MQSIDEQMKAETLQLHRAFMTAAAFCMTSFWFAYQALVPEEWDPLWVRVVISALVMAPVLLSFGSEFARRTIVMSSFFTAQLIAQWTIVLAAVNDFTVTRVVGVVLVQYCASYLFNTVRTNLVLQGFTLSGLAISLVYITEAGLVGGWITLITVITMAIFSVLWGALYNRTVQRLGMREVELREARAHLEDRVQARTEELEREVMERRLAEERASEASRAKSFFLANMSHELRTPLNAVMGYAELVSEDLEPHQREARTDLQRILDAASYLLAMINDILDLAKVESGTWEYVFEPNEVADLVEQATSTVAPMVTERGNRLVVDVEPNLPLVRTDGTRLVQILVNLMNNAAKFTDDGEIRLRAKSGRHSGGMGLVFEVEDTGPGIPEDQLERVFDKFVQLDAPGSPKRRGTGLGLAISREMARGMGGNLSVASVLGEGSTFTVWLPWERASPLSTLTG